MLMQNRAGLQVCLEEAELNYVPTIVLDFPGVQITPPDEAVAERYGYLVRDLRQQGTPIPTNDLWIAASALETGARLVSYDAHFECVPGLIVIAP